MKNKEIRIYAADVTPLENPLVFEKVYSQVSEYRRKKTDRLRFEKDKMLSVGAEYLLMCACNDFGIDYGRQTVVTGEHDKPSFEGNDVCFNLSHSERRVMCVMSYLPVGCDVEKEHPIDLKIAKRYFNSDEYEALSKCPEYKRESMFYRLWTLKESFMKCTGLGFHLPLSSFSVVQNNNGFTVSHSVDDACYILSEQCDDDGYHFAVCVRDSDEQNICNEIRWIEIE